MAFVNVNMPSIVGETFYIQNVQLILIFVSFITAYNFSQYIWPLKMY